MLNNLLPHLSEGNFWRNTNKKRGGFSKHRDESPIPKKKRTISRTPPSAPRKRHNDKDKDSSFVSKPRNLLSSFESVKDATGYSLDEMSDQADEIETVLETINESNRVVLSKIPDAYETNRLMTFALHTASQACSSELNAFDAVTEEMYTYLNSLDSDETETKDTTAYPSLLNRKRSYAPPLSSEKKKDTTTKSSLITLQRVCEEYLSDEKRIGEEKVSTLELVELNAYHVKRASTALKALAFLSRVAELVVYSVIGNMSQFKSGASVEYFVSDALKQTLQSTITSPLCRAAFELRHQAVPFKPSDEVLEIVNVICKVLCEDVQGTIETNRRVNFVPCIQINPDNEKCGRVRSVSSSIRTSASNFQVILNWRYHTGTHKNSFERHDSYVGGVEL